GDNQLLTVNGSTGIATLIDSDITVDGVSVDLTAIEVNAAGDLVGIDESLGNGNRRLVVIDPNTGDAAQASAIGSVSDELVGLGADQDGRFYSIFDNASGDDELVVSGNSLYTFSDIDSLNDDVVASPEATLVGALIDGGVAITSTVNALAVVNVTVDLDEL